MIAIVGYHEKIKAQIKFNTKKKTETDFQQVWKRRGGVWEKKPE